MAIGDIIGLLFESLPGDVTFSLTSNPGGFFEISGADLKEAINTPRGDYPITITATGVGFEATRSFVLQYAPLYIPTYYIYGF